jgi:hypothetical protein
MLLAVGLEIEREPLSWQELPSAVGHWVQDAGLVAALALWLWFGLFLSRLLRRDRQGLQPAWLTGGYLLLFVVIWLLYLVSLVTFFLAQQSGRPTYTRWHDISQTLAGGLALAAAGLPPLAALVGRLRWRRIWTLALLSIKEAIRGRVLYVFGLMALVFLFAGYFVPYRPADQIRNYVAVIFWPLTVLFVVLAALLGSFSIPRDVVKQTIHTVVTKPVERFEIVLGRFLGNALLLTVALFLLTAISLLYLVRGVTPEAAAESYKARVLLEPERLRFHGTGKEDRGENVGREWELRSYIRGRTVQNVGQPRQYAIWWFSELPAELAEGAQPARFEFTFDIYRQTKPEKGKEGVFCNLLFADGWLSIPEIERRLQQLEQDRPRLLQQQLAKEREGTDPERVRQQVEDQLIERYGLYESRNILVIDYHIGKLEVPASLFRKLRQAHSNPPSRLAGSDTEPELKVLLWVGEDRNSAQQLIGVSKRDLYLVLGELPFELNFFKGALGLWFLTLLVLGVALACSTYFSGVISLLCTGFLVGAGALYKFIEELASGRAPGGGPFQAAYRILYHLPIAAPVEQTPIATLGEGIDKLYAGVCYFLLKIVPDLERYHLTQYVAGGYDIPWVRVLFLDNFVPWLGYLLPWLILAYYLMRSREIANPS